MKITELTAFQPATPGSPSDWRTQLGQIIVRVETDDGMVGVGVGGGGKASIHVIETVLRDLLIGRDARNVEKCYHDMCRSTVFYGRSGLVMMAISGVDLALWDIRGKVADRPVARLLNPKVDLKQPIPTYCTVFDDIATAAALQAGHRAIKLHVERFGDRPDPSLIADLVARVRDVLGPEGMLMIDAFARWDVESTLAVARAIERYNVAWLEEPITPDDLDGYARLAAESPVPIAG
ncbi:MAG: mandelate racemase/muconate lactonizing enzyme family protein, partial [Planctomycetes bacterium]|nr:mandelate racemase/muconate lactonizing enzyme family protein [Planctomycetota bacterium]